MQEKLAQLGLVIMDELESNANALYQQGDHQLLLDIWDEFPVEKRPEYPNYALNIAKILVSRNRITDAYICLDICLEAWKHNGNSLARVYILHALIHRYNNDLGGLAEAIDLIFAHAEEPHLIGEAHNLLGELRLMTIPSEALPHFEEAITHFKKARQKQPSIAFDLARLHRQAAKASFQQGMHDTAMRHQRLAMDYVRGMGNATTLLAWDYILAGSMRAALGRHREAAENYNKAETYLNPDMIFASQLYCYRAQLAMMRGEDTTAADNLAKISINTLDNDHLIINVLATQSYLDLYTDHLILAEPKIKEALHLASKTVTLHYEVKVVEAALRVRRRQVDADFLLDLAETVNFFATHQLAVESSKAYLIYAWAGAVGGQPAEMIHEALVNCIRNAALLGNIWHVYRLYLLSHDDLAGYWEGADQSLNFWMRQLSTIKTTIQPTGVRVFALGQTRVFAGDKVLIARGQKNITLTLLLYMLKARTASLEDIINTLWHDELDEPWDTLRSRFSFAMHNLKRELGIKVIQYNATFERYELIADAIRFYDVEEFTRLFQEIHRTRSGKNRLIMCQRALATYSGAFAADLNNPHFDHIRHVHEASYVRLLQISIQQAEALERPDLAETWRSLLNETEYIPVDKDDEDNGF